MRVTGRVVLLPVSSTPLRRVHRQFLFFARDILVVMTLEDELMEIRGIGEAKADEVLDVLEAHEKSVESEVAENIKSAWDYYDAGYESYAGKFLKRAYEGLE